NQTMTNQTRGNRRRQLVRVGVLAAEERIGAEDGPGVVENVAGANVFYLRDGGEHAVVDAIVRLALFFDHADRRTIERVDSLAVAENGDVVDDEMLVRRIEVEIELRCVL